MVPKVEVPARDARSDWLVVLAAKQHLEIHHLPIVSNPAVPPHSGARKESDSQRCQVRIDTPVASSRGSLVVLFPLILAPSLRRITSPPAEPVRCPPKKPRPANSLVGALSLRRYLFSSHFPIFPTVLTPRACVPGSRRNAQLPAQLLPDLDHPPIPVSQMPSRMLNSSSGRR